MKILFLFGVVVLSVLCYSQNISPYRIFFTENAARTDTSKNSEDEYESNESIVLVDLNDDTFPEKFLIDEEYSGVGGCRWIIYDGKTKRKIGVVNGAIVYILKKKQNMYPLIETYWKYGDNTAMVYYYAYTRNRYEQTGSTYLDENRNGKYFQTKPPMSKEFLELHE